MTFLQEVEWARHVFGWGDETIQKRIVSKASPMNQILYQDWLKNNPYRNTTDEYKRDKGRL